MITIIYLGTITSTGEILWQNIDPLLVHTDGGGGTIEIAHKERGIWKSWPENLWSARANGRAFFPIVFSWSLHYKNRRQARYITATEKYQIPHYRGRNRLELFYKIFLVSLLSFFWVQKLSKRRFFFKIYFKIDKNPFLPSI